MMFLSASHSKHTFCQFAPLFLTLILITRSNWLARFYTIILSFFSLQLICNVWGMLLDFVNIVFLFKFLPKWFINSLWFLLESIVWEPQNDDFITLFLSTFISWNSNVIKFFPSLLTYSWILIFSVVI